MGTTMMNVAVYVFIVGFAVLVDAWEFSHDSISANFSTDGNDTSRFDLDSSTGHNFVLGFNWTNFKVLDEYSNTSTESVDGSSTVTVTKDKAAISKKSEFYSEFDIDNSTNATSRFDGSFFTDVENSGNESSSLLVFDDFRDGSMGSNRHEGSHKHGDHGYMNRDHHGKHHGKFFSELDNSTNGSPISELDDFRDSSKGHDRHHEHHDHGHMDNEHHDKHHGAFFSGMDNSTNSSLILELNDFRDSSMGHDRHHEHHGHMDHEHHGEFFSVIDNSTNASLISELDDFRDSSMGNDRHHEHHDHGHINHNHHGEFFSVIDNSTNASSISELDDFRDSSKGHDRHHEQHDHGHMDNEHHDKHHGAFFSEMDNSTNASSILELDDFRASSMSHEHHDHGHMDHNHHGEFFSVIDNSTNASSISELDGIRDSSMGHEHHDHGHINHNHHGEFFSVIDNSTNATLISELDDFRSSSMGHDRHQEHHDHGHMDHNHHGEFFSEMNNSTNASSISELDDFRNSSMGNGHHHERNNHGHMDHEHHGEHHGAFFSEIDNATNAILITDVDDQCVIDVSFLDLSLNDSEEGPSNVTTLNDSMVPSHHGHVYDDVDNASLEVLENHDGSFYEYAYGENHKHHHEHYHNEDDHGYDEHHHQHHHDHYGRAIERDQVDETLINNSKIQPMELHANGTPRTESEAVTEASSGNYWGFTNTFSKFHPWVNWFVGVPPSTDASDDISNVDATTEPPREMKSLTDSESSFEDGHNDDAFHFTEFSNLTIGDSIVNDSLDHVHNESCGSEFDLNDTSLLIASPENEFVWSDGSETLLGSLIIDLEATNTSNKTDNRNERQLDFNETSIGSLFNVTEAVVINESTDAGKEPITTGSSLDPRTGFVSDINSSDKKTDFDRNLPTLKADLPENLHKLLDKPSLVDHHESSTSTVKSTTSTTSTTEASTTTTKRWTISKPTMSSWTTSTAREASTTTTKRWTTVKPGTSTYKSYPSGYPPRPYAYHPVPYSHELEETRENEMVASHEEVGMSAPVFASPHEDSYTPDKYHEGAPSDKYEISEISGYSGPVFVQPVDDEPRYECPSHLAGHPCPTWLMEKDPHCDTHAHCLKEYPMSMCCLYNCRRRCIGNVYPYVIV